MNLSVFSWILAILPVILLLIGLLVFKWTTSRVGTIAMIAAFLIGLLFFGADIRLLTLASCKGVSLSIYVLLIIWCAVLLYNIADQAGGISVIGDAVKRTSDDELILCLMLSWCFTSLLQGLAGFGVPVAVVAPIMVAMGFRPTIAAATCLVGHSWAISFGSMGSSYNAIQLVTGLPGETIGPVMALLFIAAIFATGLAVAHIYGGMAAVKRALLPVLLAGCVMSGCMYLMNLIGAAQLASLIAAVSGCIVLIGYNAVRSRGHSGKAVEQQPVSREGMPFITACLPYMLLIALSIISQIGPIKNALKSVYWGLDYPAMETALGYAVNAETAYSKIVVFSHPAMLLLISAIAGYFVYGRSVALPKGFFAAALKKTAAKCVPTSMGIITMVMMALIMIDSGMTYLIAQGSAAVLQGVYPLIAPFIGTLGTFITGSNTNSNIMFGALQYETALLLGKSSTLLAAAQSVGGSLGVAIAPSTIMMSASNVGLTGNESSILRITAKYCLSIVLIIGIITLLFS